MITHQPYPSDISDAEWEFVVPYLCLLPEDAGQRVYDLRAVLRFAAGKEPEPTATIFDGRTMQSTPESGSRAGYDGYKRRKGSKVHMAVDTLGHLLAVHVTPANEQERDQVAVLSEAVQAVTGESVEIAFVDQGYTGDDPDA